MGKIVVSQFVSLDGVVEDPAGIEGLGRGAWCFEFDRGPEGDQYKVDEVLASDALLLGRLTYRVFADSWPSRDGEFADKFNTMPKYLVSTTMTEGDWNNTTVIGYDVAARVAQLKDEHDGDILVNGSTQVVHTLMEHDLVDEWRLMVFPVVIGIGRRMFNDVGRNVALRLVDTLPVGPDGVIVNTYAPA